MATGPFQSKLEPYRRDIAEWRAQQPPMTYAQIAAALKERHEVTVRPETIFRFVKVRSRRSIYQMSATDMRPGRPQPKTKTSGRIPTEVEARVAALKEQPTAAEQQAEPYLPADGRLTFKRKTT